MKLYSCIGNKKAAAQTIIIIIMIPICSCVDSEQASNPKLKVCLEACIFSTVGKQSSQYATH